MCTCTFGLDETNERNVSSFKTVSNSWYYLYECIIIIWIYMIVTIYMTLTTIYERHFYMPIACNPPSGFGVLNFVILNNCYHQYNMHALLLAVGRQSVVWQPLLKISCPTSRPLLAAVRYTLPTELHILRLRGLINTDRTYRLKYSNTHTHTLSLFVAHLSLIKGDYYHVM